MKQEEYWKARTKINILVETIRSLEHVEDKAAPDYLKSQKLSGLYAELKTLNEAVLNYSQNDVNQTRYFQFYD